MKSIYQLGLLFALCWGFFAPSARATHILGSDLTWSCDPANTCNYTITCTYYQDCPTGGGVDVPDLVFTCPGQTVSSPTSLPGWLLISNGVDITPLCAGQMSDCNGGNFPGVEQFILAKTYNFCTTPTCSQWQINWTNCCRSNQITSLSNSSNTALTTNSFMTFDPNNCNSSPNFTTSPIIYLCNGQTTNYTIGATDPDGDQLTYNLIACQGSVDFPLNYAPGFNGTAPLGPNWNVTLDQNTGNLTFTNTFPQTVLAVVCVRVNEIRDGQLIGSIVRDIQVRVINCNNNLPTLTGVDGFPDYTTKACVGAPSCFTVNSYDADPGDNVTIGLLSGPPGMTLTTAGTPHPTATLCWTPTVDDIGPNTVILEVRDDNCPLAGLQQYTYTIEVGVCDPCDTVTVSPNFSYSQNLLDVTVTNTSTGAPISNTEFIWGDGSPNQLFAGNWTTPVNHSFPAAGIYNVCVKTYTYVNDVLCLDSLCKEIEVSDDGCFPHTSDWTAVPDLYNACTFHFYDNSSPASSQVAWNFGTGGGTVYGSPATHTFPGSGAYTITMTTMYTSPNAPTWFCTDTYVSTFNAGCTVKEESLGGRLSGGSGSIFWDQYNSSLRVILPQSNTPGASSASLYDLSGKLLLKKEDISGSEVTFDLSGVASGIYLVRTLVGGQMETHKFAKP